MDLGLFQKRVADLLGVDQWTLLNWGKDRRWPTARSQPGLWEFLGCTRAEPGRAVDTCDPQVDQLGRAEGGPVWPSLDGNRLVASEARAKLSSEGPV